jgi:hypothetical protein
MTKSNPTGTGNFAMNLDSDKVIGANAAMFGTSNSASGTCSFVEGSNNRVPGGYAHAAGYENIAYGMQYVIGRYVHQNVEAEKYDGSGPNSGTAGLAFMIGNGTKDQSGLAFVICYDGRTYGGEYNVFGQDYAEYFEWFDGNTNIEDRRGYFVTLDGMKIKKANNSDYILGVISGMPSIIGNSDKEWNGKYICDEFGSYIYEEKEVEEEVIIDEKTGVTETRKSHGKFHIVNPDYDPTKKYIHRSDRPEWDAVGMLGVLAVRDDGTCVINGYCQVADGGIATKSDTGYRVISRVNDHIVKIIFR